MSDGYNDSDANRKLNPTEYRQRLLNKLNCLISVLEVAIGKISQTIQTESPNRDRLRRIKTNLENTLSICRRAKATLENKLSDNKLGDSGETDASPAKHDASVSFRSYVELSSIEEFRKFKKLGAISDDELAEVDVDDLARRLLGD